MANNPFQKFDEGIRLAPQLTQPSTGLDGEIYFDETLQQYFGWKNGAWSVLGSGGFGVNFIQNFDGESSTAGWALYNDGAVPVPVNGTGGSATALTFAVTRNPTFVLYQKGSFDLTKSAVNGEGQGVSYDFTIDQGYRGYSMMVQGIYKGSANFAYGAANSVSPSDIGIFMYNIDTATLVPMSTNYLDGSGSFLAVFPTDTTSVNYRLIVHVATTNALAWDFYFDSVVVGPVQTVKGAVQTDWQTYVPAYQGLGAPTNTDVEYKRIGDSIVLRGNITLGTTTGVEARIGLPSGLTIASALSAVTVVGNQADNNETSTFLALALGGNNYITFTNVTGGGNLANSTGSSFTSGAVFTWSTIQIPIQGWSSNMILSSETSTQQVVASAYCSTNQPVSPTQPGNFDTILFDTSNSITTGSAWKFTAPSYGFYRISGPISSTVSGGLYLYKNGTNLQFLIDDVGNISASTTVQLNAGDFIDVRTTSSGSLRGGTLTTNLVSIIMIEKLSTPQTVAFDGNKVAYIKDVKASGTAGGTITSGSYVTRVLNTVEDPYNIISLSSNQFTLQPGQYEIEADCGAYEVDETKAKLRNITDSLDVSLGTVVTSPAGAAIGSSVVSKISTIFSISSAKTFAIQQRVTTSGVFGNAASYGDSEVYLIVKVVKKT